MSDFCLRVNIPHAFSMNFWHVEEIHLNDCIPESYMHPIDHFLRDWVFFDIHVIWSSEQRLSLSFTRWLLLLLCLLHIVSESVIPNSWKKNDPLNATWLWLFFITTMEEFVCQMSAMDLVQSVQNIIIVCFQTIKESYSSCAKILKQR